MNETVIEFQNEASIEQVLQKHCKLYPENEYAYSRVHSASSSLKASIATDNFCYEDVGYQILELDEVLEDEDKETKQQITIFAAEIELPKLCTGLILHLRKLHEDLTKWDREDKKTFMLSKPQTKEDLTKEVW